MVGWGGVRVNIVVRYCLQMVLIYDSSYYTESDPELLCFVTSHTIHFCYLLLQYLVLVRPLHAWYYDIIRPINSIPQHVRRFYR